MLVDIHQAKSSLSDLIERVERGEDVVIGRAGKPVVRIVKYVPPTQDRQPGIWRGRVWMADDFDELPDQVAKAFRGDNE